jgi:hypothetical protein
MCLSKECFLSIMNVSQTEVDDGSSPGLPAYLELAIVSGLTDSIQRHLGECAKICIRKTTNISSFRLNQKIKINDNLRMTDASAGDDTALSDCFIRRCCGEFLIKTMKTVVFTFRVPRVPFQQ